MSRLYPTLEDMKVDQMQQVCFKINNSFFLYMVILKVDEKNLRKKPLQVPMINHPPPFYLALFI
jgi:hypothetical protein